MKGFGGPKPAEIRGALGVDRSIITEVVPTASQAGATAYQDKQNHGFSGTPMWKIALERAKELEAMAASRPKAAKIPEGFKPVEKPAEANLPPGWLAGHWFYSEKTQVFWNAGDQMFYVWDPVGGRHEELHVAKTTDTKVSPGACFHEKAKQVKHVLMTDLVKAGQAMRMSLEHLDRPCGLYALFEGHRGSQSTGNLCTEFCVKGLHQKLLPKLAAFRGYWQDARLEMAVRESFEELDAEFAEKHPDVPDGCCAAVVLVTGQRMVLASLGDVACVVSLRNGEVSELMKAHAVRDPNDDDDSDEDDDAAANDEPPPPIKWTRTFGDLDFKTPNSVPRLSAIPDVRVLHLEPQHRGVALVCRALYNAIGRSVAVSTVMGRSQGRARMASGSLVDAAVQYLGDVGDLGLGSIIAFFDVAAEGLDGSPLAKKSRKENPSQVRLRHILLKHKDCKSTVDKVRNKQVQRTRGEAERILRAALEEVETDPKRRVFTQRCKDLSECTTSLAGGDLAGDLGWVKQPSKFGLAFDAAITGLQVGHLTDLIDTDLGTHIVLRSA